MRSVLENALEHAAVKLSDLSLLPNEVRLNNYIVYLCHLIENHSAIGPSSPPPFDTFLDFPTIFTGSGAFITYFNLRDYHYKARRRVCLSSFSAYSGKK